MTFDKSVFVGECHEPDIHGGGSIELSGEAFKIFEKDLTEYLVTILAVEYLVWNVP